MPRRNPSASTESAATPAGREVPTIEVLCGPLLCRLRVWSDAEWAELPAWQRPARADHFAGLGWVGAVPVACTN
jgi:hypothetical protein